MGDLTKETLECFRISIKVKSDALLPKGNQKMNRNDSLQYFLILTAREAS